METYNLDFKNWADNLRMCFQNCQNCFVFFFSQVVGSIAFGFQIRSTPREAAPGEAVQDSSNIPKCFEVQETAS